MEGGFRVNVDGRCRLNLDGWFCVNFKVDSVWVLQHKGETMDKSVEAASDARGAELVKRMDVAYVDIADIKLKMEDQK